MIPQQQNDSERARTATGDDLAALLHHHASNVLLQLLDNPAVDEPQVCLLLGRKDLPTEVLIEVARRKVMLKSYGVSSADTAADRCTPGPRIIPNGFGSARLATR